MFEFRKIEDPKDKRNTHHIYFKGKLLSQKAYPDGNSFWCAENIQLEENEFAELLTKDLPDDFYLTHQINNVGRELKLYGVTRKGKKLEFYFSLEIADPPSIRSYGLIFFLDHVLKKNAAFQRRIEDTSYDLTYVTKAEGTLGNAYKKAADELDMACKHARKFMKMRFEEFA